MTMVQSRRPIAIGALRAGASPLAALAEAAEEPYLWQGSSSLRHSQRAGGSGGDAFDLELARDSQYAVEWLGQWREPLPTGSPDVDIARWCEQACGDHETPAWWSIPLAPNVLVTSSAVDQIPLLLLVNEDDWGRENAIVHHVNTPDAAHIYEIDGPDAWTALVQRAPMEVTAARGSSWGGSVPGTAWFLPDWSAIAREFDGVHLSVGGYLDTAGIPLPVDGGMTMLAGMSPDSTVWLRGPLATDRSYRMRRPGDEWIVVPV
ncbi:hypothetical protein ACNANV_15100 [Curtobacterium flaccumfaciens pv. flaccumfaciens]|uniref:hypothetical protein n=1 Tax=Curtobacterium flaccumfaciens TaxID=2035 RepID=UPI003A4D5A1E